VAVVLHGAQHREDRAPLEPQRRGKGRFGSYYLEKAGRLKQTDEMRETSVKIHQTETGASLGWVFAHLR
jgi:hypothetical protein